MRVAVDDRGRVPIAMIGVVLLVTSVTFAAALETRAERTTGPRTDDALRTAQAEARSALHAAVASAARDAARAPVVAAADSPWGRVLADSAPFRDALRLRIYLAAARSLRDVHATVGAARATVSLPVPTDPAAARRALERVHIDPRANGSMLVARFDEVEVAISRGGVVRDSRTYSPRVRVETPVVGLHRAAVRYQSRLRSPDGLAARLRRTVSVLAWSRGWAQYAGAPVENVLANRHVAVLANRALLAEQRAAFGVADPAGRDGLDRALVTLAGSELATVATGDDAAASLVRDPSLSLPGLPSQRNRTVRVDVGAPADRVVATLLRDDARRVRALLTNTSIASGSGAVRPSTMAAARRALSADVARVRNASVAVRAGNLTAGFPAEALARRVRQRLETAPTESGITGGPRATLRRALASAVATDLRRRASVSGWLLAVVRDRATAVRGRGGTDPVAVAEPSPGGVVRRVDTEPSFLRLEGTAGRAPLAAANVNWFALPTGDVARETVSTTTNASGATAVALASFVEGGLEEAISRLAGLLGGTRLVGVPAGLPVVPVPGYWYATVNGWDVTVRGGYERVTLSAPGASPVPRLRVTYVREAAPVVLDVDGDGTGERVGRNEPISFSVETGTLVAVPPGGRGIGDRGTRSETSAAWPRPDVGNGSAPSSGSTP
ncbi:MAG: hypothetical protein ABEJ42_08175 [Halobacteriaceae archaeon]